MNNIPLEQLSSFLTSLGCWLFIEFILKEDLQVQRGLATPPVPDIPTPG